MRKVHLLAAVALVGSWSMLSTARGATAQATNGSPPSGERGPVVHRPSPVEHPPAEHQPTAPSHPVDRDHRNHHEQHRTRHYGYGYPYSPLIGSAYGYGASDLGRSVGYSEQPIDTVSRGVEVAPNAPVPVTPPGQTAASKAAQRENAERNSPKLIKAQAAVKKAQSDYESARKRVIAHLTTQPAYKKALDKRKQATAEVAKTRKANPRNTAAIESKAKSVLTSGDDVTQMQQKAMEQDKAASAAKAKLAKAVADLNSARESVKSK